MAMPGRRERERKRESGMGAGGRVLALLLACGGLLAGRAQGRSEPLALPSEGVSESLGMEEAGNATSVAGSNDYPEYSYFERTYASSGWFTSPPILDTHVEVSVLPKLINQRLRTHYPSSISVYAVPYPRPLIYYNIMWTVNSKSIAWRLSYNEDGVQFQKTLNNNINAGYQAYQIESYAFDDWGTIYYAAIFLQKQSWPSGTQWDIAFGFPNDASYCCGSNSRWMRLSYSGYKPVSFSITEDPSTKREYITDLWNTVDVGTWQGGMSKTAVQLQQILGSLENLTPVYIKGYRVSVPNGGHMILFTYLAKNMDAPALSLTTSVSNTAFAALAKLVKKPPVAFTSYFVDSEADYQQAGYGGMYTALWDGVTTNN